MWDDWTYYIEIIKSTTGIIKFVWKTWTSIWVNKLSRSTRKEYKLTLPRVINLRKKHTHKKKNISKPLFCYITSVDTKCFFWDVDILLIYYLDPTSSCDELQLFFRRPLSTTLWIISFFVTPTFPLFICDLRDLSRSGWNNSVVYTIRLKGPNPFLILPLTFFYRE